MDYGYKRHSTSLEQRRSALTDAFDDLMSLMLLQFPLISVFSHGQDSAPEFNEVTPGSRPFKV